MFFSRGKTHVSILKVPLDADALLTSLSCSSTAPWTLGDGGKSCMNASPPTGFTGKPHPQTHLPLGERMGRQHSTLDNSWTPSSLEGTWVLALCYSKCASWFSSISVTWELVRNAES